MDDQYSFDNNKKLKQYPSLQEETEAATIVFRQLRKRFPLASANWLGINLMQMSKVATQPKEEVYRSYIICTAVFVLGCEQDQKVKEFVKSEESLVHSKQQGSRAEDQRNLGQLIQSAVVFASNYGNKRWRLGKEGKRIALFLGMLRILQAKCGRIPLKGLPLQQVASVGMTIASGVHWEPPDTERVKTQYGTSKALLTHIANVARTSVLDYKWNPENKGYTTMDPEYTMRATRLIELACRWKDTVSSLDPRYYEVTKHHLFGPLLNPLMRMNFGDQALKKLYRRARDAMPENLLKPYYPFNDVSSSEEDEENEVDEEEDEGKQPKMLDEEEKQKKEEMLEREKKEEMLEKEKEEEMLEKEKKEEMLEKEKKKKEKLEAKVLREKMIKEGEAAAKKEKEEKEKILKMEAEEQKKHEEKKQKMKEEEKKKKEREEGKIKERQKVDLRLEIEEEKKKRFEGNRKRKNDEEKKEERSMRFGGEKKLKPIPRSQFDHVTDYDREELRYFENQGQGDAWSYSRIRDAQRNDARVCQRSPTDCQGFRWNGETEMMEACRARHPWGAAWGRNQI